MKKHVSDRKALVMQEKKRPRIASTHAHKLPVSTRKEKIFEITPSQKNNSKWGGYMREQKHPKTPYKNQNSGSRIAFRSYHSSTRYKLAREAPACNRSVRRV